MQRNRGKQENEKDQRSLQENQRYQGNIAYKDRHNKGQKQTTAQLFSFHTLARSCSKSFKLCFNSM